MASASSALWRRGKEAPMQWEFTQASGSKLPLDDATNLTLGDGDDADAMDMTVRDESMRDISMNEASGSGTPELRDVSATAGAGRSYSPLQHATTLADDDEIEDISRPASSSTGALITSSSRRRREFPIRRRRRGSSASIHSAYSQEGDGDRNAVVTGQWQIPPTIGTVINYLVPPVQDAGSSNHTPGTHLGQLPPQSQKAQATLHPRERPLLLLSYAQLAFNASLLLLAAYILFALVWTIRLDVVERLREVEEQYHHTISSCQRSFELNCLSVPLPPALHTACDEWSRCSTRKFKDVLGGSRLRIVIEVLSEAWEAGIGGLGWRTLGFSLLLISIVVGGMNSTLTGLRSGIFRNSKRQKQRKQQQQQQLDADEDDDDSPDQRPPQRMHPSPNTVPQQPAPGPAPGPALGLGYHPSLHPSAYRYQSVDYPTSPAAVAAYYQSQAFSSSPRRGVNSSGGIQSHYFPNSPSSGTPSRRKGGFGIAKGSSSSGRRNVGLYPFSTSSSTSTSTSGRGGQGRGSESGSEATIVDEWVDDD